MSLFTNKKFELLLNSYHVLEDNKKHGLIHQNLPIDELFLTIRSVLQESAGFDYKKLVPYPSHVNQIEEVSVMDLTNGFTSNPNTWKVVQEGEGCRGMFIWVDAPDESDYRYIDDEEDEDVDIDDSYGNGHPVMLFWLSEDYQYVTASDRDKNYTEYEIDNEEAQAVFSTDFPNIGMSLLEMYEILKMTMLYQVAFSCRIVKEDDDVYKHYNNS